MATNERGHEVHPCGVCGKETEGYDGRWVHEKCVKPGRPEAEQVETAAPAAAGGNGKTGGKRR